MANSPRDSRRYNDAQIEAIMRAHLIDGHIVSEVWRMASRGELGVPAFEPDRRYIYQLIKHNRDAFEASNPDALRRSTEKALAKAHMANLRALQTLGTDADPAERARVAKAVADTLRTVAGDNRSTTRTKREPEQHNASKNPTSEAVLKDRTLTNLLDLASPTRIKPPTNDAPKPDQVSARAGSLPRAQIDTASEPDAA
jgi:hypothetical protein